MAVQKHDNSALEQKASLRLQALADAPFTPIALETMGGEGMIYLRCYTGIQKGWVFEKNPDLLIPLTEQRPTWWAYQGEAERILGDCPDGFNANFIDIDPHGSPWPTLEALFHPRRFTHPEIYLVVHDGSRRFLSVGGSGSNDQRWRHGILAELAADYGDDLRTRYSDIAQVAIAKLAKPCGYTIKKWLSFYTGHDKNSTHYWATLHRSDPRSTDENRAATLELKGKGKHKNRIT